MLGGRKVDIVMKVLSLPNSTDELAVKSVELETKDFVKSINKTLTYEMNFKLNDLVTTTFNFILMRGVKTSAVINFDINTWPSICFII